MATRIRLVLLTLTCLLPTAVRADLDAYLRKPEPAYRWEKRGEETRNGVKIYDLHLVSQTWQGAPWEHRLVLFRPVKLDHPEFCTLYNTGGNGGARDMQQGVDLATSAGCNYAILFNIPNQPLYGGRTEDALIVYTWLQYLKTGDESWPLHFPMAKAVLKAMDAIQAFSRQEHLPEVTGFLVHGASKRGWTTWLAGASQDARIKAIAPMVIDILNVARQSQHQLEAYGKPSEQIGDYTSAGFQQALQTPAGQRLMALEDPYSYRERLTLPKLLILGTNDRYWTQDALNLYWDDLRGPKWVLYVPNSGHGLEDRPRVMSTLAAFVRSVAGHKAMPRMRWRYEPQGMETVLRVESDMRPTEGRLFHVHSATQDFRDSRWSFEPMRKTRNGFEGHWPRPREGFDAIYGELVYNVDGRPFTLTTQIRILGAQTP